MSDLGALVLKSIDVKHIVIEWEEFGNTLANKAYMCNVYIQAT